jgi:hypothetical protein
MHTINDSRFKGEKFTIKSIDLQEDLVLLRADLIDRGFDGSVYVLDRVLTGRKKQKQVYCYRSSKTSQFCTVL